MEHVLAGTLQSYLVVDSQQPKSKSRLALAELVANYFKRSRLYVTQFCCTSDVRMFSSRDMSEGGGCFKMKTIQHVIQQHICVPSLRPASIFCEEIMSYLPNCASRKGRGKAQEQ